MTDQSNRITSPCIGICAVSEQNICLGCYRTLDEISAWVYVDDKTRTLILTNCLKREILLNNA